MKEETYTLLNDAGAFVHIYHWSPSSSKPIKAVIQIAHGMAEAAERYVDLAKKLTNEGFIIYAHDHRGHGKTSPTIDDLGYPGNNGVEGMFQDIILVRSWILERHPDTPLFLLGHSMGSFLTQKMMFTSHEPYHGFILSGTNGPQPFIGLALSLAKLESQWRGHRHPSKLLNALSFGSFNHKFRPIRTPFDWLTRDKHEVDLYMQNPYCGFLCSSEFFHGLFRLLKNLHNPQLMRQIDIHKPVYIFSGDQDPVGGFGTGIKKLTQLYHAIGLRDLEVKLYEGGRHEMLHEINRDEVMENISRWLHQHI